MAMDYYTGESDDVKCAIIDAAVTVASYKQGDASYDADTIDASNRFLRAVFDVEPEDETHPNFDDEDDDNPAD